MKNDLIAVLLMALAVCALAWLFRRNDKVAWENRRRIGFKVEPVAA
jgi:hypothetical protein